MIRLLKRLQGSEANRPVRKSPKRGSQPQLERLEERQLLAVGTSFTLGTIVEPTLEAANASSKNGMSVAVWSEQYSSSDWDIKAQIYRADGSRLGHEITVANSVRNEHEPAVAMDAQGNFVVVWTDDWSSTDWDIRAQRFSANGSRLGSEILVTTLDSSSDPFRREFDGSVAMDQNGAFVVSYTQAYSSTDLDVRAKMFDSSGVALGGSFGVCIEATNEYASSVARTDDGRFAIAYQYGEDIWVNQYSAGGRFLRYVGIATGSTRQLNPSIAMDASGNAVVAWEEEWTSTDHDIKARRVANNGTAGSVKLVQSSSAFEEKPSVALSRSGSSFVVAYETGLFAWDQRIKVTEVWNSPVGDAVQRTLAIEGEANAAISFDDSDSYFVTYAAYGPTAKGNWGQVSSSAPSTKLAHDFNIEVNFIGTNWTAARKDIVRQAADRWEEVILGDLPTASHWGQLVDDLLIDANIINIDGVNGTLAAAKFDAARDFNSGLPYYGHMNFDLADPITVETTLHEMGHVLGIGTLWGAKGLLIGAGGSDPRFVGSRATAEFNSIFGSNAIGVPVHNTGGGGSRDSHWRETVLTNELMTAINDSGADPLSRITVASLADLGYTVNMNATDPFSAPTTFTGFVALTSTGSSLPAFTSRAVGNHSHEVVHSHSVSPLRDLSGDDHFGPEGDQAKVPVGDSTGKIREMALSDRSPQFAKIGCGPSGLMRSAGGMWIHDGVCHLTEESARLFHAYFQNHQARTDTGTHMSGHSLFSPSVKASGRDSRRGVPQPTTHQQAIDVLLSEEPAHKRKSYIMSQHFKTIDEHFLEEPNQAVGAY